LDDDAKWKYTEHLKKFIDKLYIQAKKNCEECEKYLITPEDINIDMLFEDWRECADDCEQCKKENQVSMCEVQFQLMSHLADGIGRLTSKVNILTRLYLNQDKEGNKFLKQLDEKKKKLEDTNRELYQ